ncbi:hypothetical protein [Thiobacillus sp.]
MMAILTVFLVLGISRHVVIVERIAVMVVADVVRMETRGRAVFPRMPVYANGRSPGKLERNDEHDDQGDEAAHRGDSTGFGASTKDSIVPTLVEGLDRLRPNERSCEHSGRSQANGGGRL